MFPSSPRRILLRDGRLRKGWFPVLLLVGIAAVSYGAVQRVRSPEITIAMRGQKLAQELGCFACHGPDGIGGIPDPLSPAGRMPGWEKGAAVLYVDSEKEIEEWIIHGRALDDEQASIPGLKPENIEPMPAYAGMISESELEELVAYFKAVAQYHPEIPDEAYEGSVIAERMGCFGCHGPSGMGGIPNPRSFTGIIPAWEGKHFSKLVKDDSELREWILDGAPKRLLDHPVGRYFLERQIIQMPGYRAYLTDEELEKIIIYIKWLRGHEAKDKEAENPIA